MVGRPQGSAGGHCVPDKGAAEEIWVGLEVAEGPPPLAALIDFEISSKTFPDKLAWAVASHLFRGEAMRLTGG